ncbi:MAG: xanthine dehydrogenase family protein subunit M [Candidatus Eremiobacterota bacterium]
MSVSVFRPETVEELFCLMETEPVPHYFLAGGTDLLVQAKDGAIPPSTWFDVTALRELTGIRVEEGRVVLGAAVTHDELTRSDTVRHYAPALVDGAAVIGGPQIRNRGTVGGNLANGSPAADTVPALYTLEAEVGLRRRAALRWVAIADFFLGPRKTLLEPGEIIEAVRFPAREGMRGAFVRLGQRRSQAISKVSVAVSCVVSGDRFEYLGIACGSVAPTVIRCPRAEAALRERGLAGASEACRLIREEVRPIDDIRSTAAYRRAMSGVLLARVLETLALT